MTAVRSRQHLPDAGVDRGKGGLGGRGSGDGRGDGGGQRGLDGRDDVIRLPGGEEDPDLGEQHHEEQEEERGLRPPGDHHRVGVVGGGGNVRRGHEWASFLCFATLP